MVTRATLDIKKGKGQCQVAVVVEAGDQHRDEDRTQHEAEASGENINPPSIDADRQAVAAMTSNGPGPELIDRRLAQSDQGLRSLKV